MTRPRGDGATAVTDNRHRGRFVKITREKQPDYTVPAVYRNRAITTRTVKLCMRARVSYGGLVFFFLTGDSIFASTKKIK